MRTYKPLSQLGLFATVVHGQSLVGFGPAFSLGPTQSWIRESTTTLVLPKIPSPQQDRLALWPGMGTSNGDMIQALAVAFSDPARYLLKPVTSQRQITDLGNKAIVARVTDNGAPGQALWKVWPRMTLTELSMKLTEAGEQLGGTEVPASAGQKLTIHCETKHSTKSSSEFCLRRGQINTTI